MSTNNDHNCKAKEDILKKEKEREEKIAEIKNILIPFTKQLEQDFCCLEFPYTTTERGPWYKFWSPVIYKEEKNKLAVEVNCLTPHIEYLIKGIDVDVAIVYVLYGKVLSAEIAYIRDLSKSHHLTFCLLWDKEKNKYYLYKRNNEHQKFDIRFYTDEYDKFYNYVLDYIMNHVKYEYKK